MSMFINGTRVSWPHYVILKEAEKRNIINNDDPNEGRRTMGEQWGFYRIYLRDGKPKAAFPTPWAPHIKVGRTNHALDVDAPHPNEALAAFYRSLGVPVVHNVAGEPWHMDFPDERALIRAATRLKERGGLLVTLSRGDRHDDVLSLRHMLWDAGYKKATTKFNKRYYGKELEKLVKTFQRRHGIHPDGVVTPKTWNKLKSVGSGR